jgi:3-hydroxyacyl-[acyl-carrier-protein] dehydratase
MDDMTKRDIEELLPHRPPFVFVDKIVQAEGASVTTSKIFSEDEEYFKGHFPGNPIVPGVLLIESMAQTAGLAASNVLSKGKKHEGAADVFYLSRVAGMKFKKPVLPGQEVRVRAEVVMSYGTMAKVSVESKVDGETVAEGELVLSKRT